MNAGSRVDLALVRKMSALLGNNNTNAPKWLLFVFKPNKIGDPEISKKSDSKLKMKAPQISIHISKVIPTVYTRLPPAPFTKRIQKKHLSNPQTSGLE